MSSLARATVVRPDEAVDALCGEAAEAAAASETETDDGAAGWSLTRALRAAGALLLLASASTFMLQQWGAGNDVWRYLTLLGHAMLLGVAGLVLGSHVRESRGARTFLSLSLATTPVHFAVLGGLLRSQLSLGDATLPPAVLWRAPSLVAALGLLAVGLAVLYPLCRLALSVLVRPHARWLTHAFLGLNALLLVPLRVPAAAGVLLCIALGAFCVLQRSPRMQHAALRTLEGRLVRALLVAPAVLIAGRCLLFYQPDVTFVGLALLGLGLALFALARSWVAAASTQGTLQGIGSGLAALGAFALGGAVLDGLHPPLSAALPLLVVPPSVVLLALSRLAVAGGRGQRLGAALLCAMTLPVQVLTFPLLLSTLLAVALGLLVMAAGVEARHRAVVLAGAAVLLTGVVEQLYLSIHFEALWHWASLSALGALSIFAASLIERRRAALSAWLDRSRARWAEWS